tara:strand:+ start:312 stop:764 length:453 start_codon:yes stop_codon:yes gene_type:complete
MSLWSLSEIQTNHIISTQPKKMLEWGSGEASKKFVEAGIDLTSIEHNEGMPSHSGNFRLIPPTVRTHFEPKEFLDWSSYIKVTDIDQFDTILIDGECRGECLAWTALRANKDAKIYLDDYERGYYSWALEFFDVINVIQGFAHLAELRIK